MGYYKSTTYYGQNKQDWSDKSSEAKAERQARQASEITTIPDAKTCLSCGNEAPKGWLWYQGTCKDCKK